MSLAALVLLSGCRLQKAPSASPTPSPTASEIPEESPSTSQTPPILVEPGPILTVAGEEFSTSQNQFVPMTVRTSVTYIATVAHPELQPDIERILTEHEKSYRGGTLVSSDGWVVLKPKAPLQLSIEPNKSRFLPAEGLFYLRRNGELWFSSNRQSPPDDCRLVGRVEFPRQLLHHLETEKESPQIENIIFGLTN